MYALFTSYLRFLSYFLCLASLRWYSSLSFFRLTTLARP